jgi:hypothetical protein
MQEALKVARKLGLVDDISRLEKMLEASKEGVKVGAKFIKESIAKIVDWLKSPEGKKLGQYLLYGLLGILALLLVTTVLGASAMTGALGGGGH